MDQAISDTVRFWLYLFFLIPSFFCSIFVLYHLFCHGKLRSHLFNHTVVVILIIGLIYQVTIYPWMLYYYHQKGVWERPLIFCAIWSFIDWGLYYTQIILIAWATIERHILIFHDRWVGTSRRRFLIHYLPLTLLTVYCVIYYSVIEFFPPCENKYRNGSIICLEICSMAIRSLYAWDLIVHQVLPNLIIITFSIALIVRVFRQKRRIGQTLRWQKHRRMTIQLLSISILYLTCAFPITVFSVFHLNTPIDSIRKDMLEYLLLFNYSMILLFPFVCLFSLPNGRYRLKIRFYFGRRSCRTVGPTSLSFGRTRHERMLTKH